MEIFKRLKKLGYKHYLDYTVEELDKLSIESKEFSIEANLAFDWFREKGYRGEIKSYYVDELMFFIGIETNERSYEFEEAFKTYQEAQLVCLEKLIEIVEQQKE